AKQRIYAFFLKEWFCAKLVVTTPEGAKIHFPCYQWLNKKKPVVCLCSDKATLVNKETNSILLNQRQQELIMRQQEFRWKPQKGIPWCIDADEASDLPNEVRFSFTKRMELDYNAVKVLVELELESLMHCTDTWRSLDELHKLLRQPKPKGYVYKHWDSDEFFGYQCLNGMNPMVIERCSTLPNNFPVTDDMVKSSLGGSCLKKEMEKGNIFLCDYKNLNGFKGNMINDKKQYLAAPLCLLFSTPEKKLIPIAIQLYQEPGLENPIFLPTDSKWDWLLAKIFVRSAEFHEHELNFHLLRTHLLAEVFSVATLRNLPSAHPLFKLLIPHTRYTLQINILARNLLISNNGIFKKFTAMGRDDAVEIFLPRAVSSLTYSSLCLPDNIKERGLEEIPNYYYRDDGLKLWDIIHKYRIPSSFSTVEELVKFVTMVIFTVCAQHAAVNNGQFDFGGWMPNLPSSLRCPPPERKGESTERIILETLPDVTTTIHGLAVLFLLSKASFDYVSVNIRQLGEFKEELFGDEAACQCISEFKKDLRVLDEEIDIRTGDLELPYCYLKPATVENSVAL
ncbi:hypothetical protein NFI96_030476, partial [Prochilodus magdalenae]